MAAAAAAAAAERSGSAPPPPLRAHAPPRPAPHSRDRAPATEEDVVADCVLDAAAELPAVGVVAVVAVFVGASAAL